MAKTLIGKVVSAKPDKTAVVAVVSRRRHPLYDKAYLSTKKIMVEDSNNKASEGDRVEIAESRRTSSRKGWKLVKVIETSQEAES